jgi:hypothetical protein
MTTTRAALSAALPLLLTLAACGETKTETVTEYVTVTGPAGTYIVDYVAGTTNSVVGKSTFQLRVRTRATGAAATGLAASLRPVMYMPTYNHGAPADVVTESTTTPGTYDCTVYYQMASGPGLGYWEVSATIGTERVAFYPAVDMPMGTDSTLVRLWGGSDVGAGGMSSTKYVIFNDGPLSATAGSLKLYLSRSQNMMMDFKPVYVGSVLAAPTGTVTGVSLTASADAAFTTPIVATHSANGHWTIPLTGLVAGTQTTVYLKLNVNAEDKTTDGLAVSATNANASVAFKVTPQ